MSQSSSQTQLDTRLLHLGLASFNPETGAAPVAQPSVRTSTVRFRDLAALEQAQALKASGERGVTYGRVGLETHDALEQVFCELEGAQRCFLAPSGLSAITLAMMGLLSYGEHVLVADCAYGPVRYLDKVVLSRMGIQVSYGRAQPQDLQAQLKPNTRMLYVESPGSLLFEMLDLPALSKFAQKNGLLLVVDNTWGSGYIYQPLALGADVSVVAGTKYVGGHSDLMLGAVLANDPAVAQRINDTHYAMGYAVSADDAWLALRGVRTLSIRLKQHAANALEVCRFLANRPEVERIYHPAWPQDAGHTLWQRDCTGSNGMLSVELKFDQQRARQFVDALSLFGIGFSWGGYESLVQWVEPSSIACHSYCAAGDNAVVRMHIGLESAQDIIADIEQALNAVA